MDENEPKRKEVDIQESSPSSNLSAPSSPVDLKNRRLGAAASPDDIIKNINFMRYFKNVEGYEAEMIEAVEALEGILSSDRARFGDIMLSEGITSLLIEQISETAPPSGSNSPSDQEVLEEHAVNLLRELVTLKPEVGRDIIEEGAIPRLFQLLRRKHKHAADEMPLRLTNVVFQTLERVSHSWPDVLLETILLQRDYDEVLDIVQGLMSPLSEVQVLACTILRDLAGSRNGEHVFVSNDCATQLSVLLSSMTGAVRAAAAGTIMALCFSEQENHGLRIDTFIETGVLQPIVQLLYDADEVCASIAARLLTRFLRARVVLTTTFTLAGAVRPLISMLQRPSLLKDAVFTLHHLSLCIPREAVGSQIFLEGGLASLMTAFRLPEVQNNRELAVPLARLLFRLAGYRAGIVFFIKMGGLSMLETTKMPVRAVRKMASTFFRHMELLFSRGDDEYSVKNLVLVALEAEASSEVKSRCVYALALYAYPGKFEAIFVSHKFLDLLLDNYGRFSNQIQQQEASEALYSVQQQEAAKALYNIVYRSRMFLIRHAFNNNIDLRYVMDEVYNYQSEEILPYVPPTNVDQDFDVTFLLDNNTKQVRAHKRVLREASAVFAVLLDDDSEFLKTGAIIEVSHVGFAEFKSVVDFIYTGDLPPDISPYDYYDIFIVADFYSILPLKRICEVFIADHIAIKEVEDVYGFADTYNAKFLIHSCILFVLKNHQHVCSLPWFPTLVKKIIPEIREWLPSTIPGLHNVYLAPLSGL